jgi:hypothetical protein
VKYGHAVMSTSVDPSQAGQSAKPHPEAKGIGQLFDSSSPLRTPIIQRSYAWKQDQVNEFWDDLSDARDAGRYHFLGLIVVDQAGRIHDGQQRLATTFVLLQVLKAALEASRSGLTQQETLDSNVDGLFVALSDALQGKKQTPSPPIVIGKSDQGLLVDPTTGVLPSTESAVRLTRARGALTVRLTEELDVLPAGVGRVEALWSWWNFLAEEACVIELIVSAQTASSIFETLNTRGVHLSVADLVKSYLLATLDDTLQEQGMTIWETITTTLEKETALNEFILHYWGSRYGQITRDQLFPSLKDRVQHRPAAALRELQSYQKDSVLYAALRNADNPFWLPYGETASDAIRLINALGLTQLRYLLLAIMREYPKNGQSAAKRRNAQGEALKWLAAWAIRGVVTRKTGGKPAENAYLEAAKAVRDGTAKRVADIKKIFVTAARTSSDDDFERELARASLNATATRVVIYALEAHLMGKDAPLGAKPRLTREHVLPQSWTESSWGQFNEATHAEYVERLGNTLLLTGITNTSLKNKSWSEKKSLILGKGVQQLSLTEEALKETQWTKGTIERRQERMAKLALQVWPS